MSLSDNLRRLARERVPTACNSGSRSLPRATPDREGSATQTTRSLHWEETLLPGVVPGAKLDL